MKHNETKQKKQVAQHMKLTSDAIKKTKNKWRPDWAKLLDETMNQTETRNEKKSNKKQAAKNMKLMSDAFWLRRRNTTVLPDGAKL